MYKDKKKSKICINGFSSNLLNCNVGVRQGETLTPFFFPCIFMTQKIICQTKMSTITEGIVKELFHFKECLSCFMQTTMLVQLSLNYLQFALNEFYKYCDKWTLKVNILVKQKLLYFLRTVNLRVIVLSVEIDKGIKSSWCNFLKNMSF